MGKMEIESLERRNFLRVMPAATAAGLILTEEALFAPRAGAQSMNTAGAQGLATDDNAFKVIQSAAVDDAIEKIEANPGNAVLYQSPKLALSLTCEKAKSAPNFEWHEHRDHVFHILEGSTVFELGGTPQGAHSTGPGEWLAPASQGTTSVTLGKGEFLVILRGTPHRRTTKESVVLALIAPISAEGPA